MRRWGLNGLAWQLTLGAGQFVCYSVMGAPFYDRLLATTRTEGTISVLIFLSDMFGYAVTVSMLLFQDLSPGAAASSNGTAGKGGGSGGQGHHNEQYLATYLLVLWGCGGAIMLLLLLSMAYFAVKTRAPADTLLDCQTR